FQDWRRSAQDRRSKRNQVSTEDQHNWTVAFRNSLTHQQYCSRAIIALGKFYIFPNKSNLTLGATNLYTWIRRLGYCAKTQAKWICVAANLLITAALAPLAPLLCPLKHQRRCR